MQYSRIPSISAASTPESSGYPPLKRQRIHSSMLQDVTNQIHSTGPRRSVTEEPKCQKTRLMNKYVFGDASVIEEVKKRERKIMRDIAHFRNAIAEIEKETAQIRDRQLPDIQYEISKKMTMCGAVKKEISQLESQLDMKDREIDLCRKNGELDVCNLQLRYSVEIQELENNLKQRLDEENLKWERKIMELENLKPDEQVAEEIRHLKGELQEVEKRWVSMQEENQRKSQEYERDMQRELDDFKNLKMKPMEDLIEEQKQLKEKMRGLFDERNRLTDEANGNRKQSELIEAEIVEIQQKIDEIKAKNEPLHEDLTITINHFEKIRDETERVQEKAHARETFYQEKFDKMEQEQLRRRKLENTIDELKGRIRTFAYITRNCEKSGLDVNYHEKSLKEPETGRKYQFSRMIPSALETEKNLLYQEYEMFQEMCLKKSIHFSLISISQKPWEALRLALLEFMYNKCHEKYRIAVQYVFLSEESPSQDLLLPSAEDGDNEIKLKIQKESLELDSKIIEVTDVLNNLPSNLRRERPNHIPGIGILKFHLTPQDKGQKLLNFYFVEINDINTIGILNKVVNPSQELSSPISLIMKKILSDTTSCFLFNINDAYDNELLLELSKKIGHMRNSKKRKVSE
ncbi:hypothetical protein HG536_0A08600 [Torulaspora globosa]|uniref:Spindle pole body-associated protein Vik1/Cik1 microtubule binding domain-containing protein n=1 Tax=Torulaspora globosa TaxID=48254 RepID=A0A7G3ZC07_9SACH|nr:uncharacterized protein HG536_0A08600 [Torulaspora globosa]QLL31043.1 hypothetical protein HG536_0A08600 [Torulaspora globosa]